MAWMCTSDWHLNNGNDANTGGILKFERGDKFATIQEHDRYVVNLVRQWLKKLHKDDTFYFLGDFGRPTPDTFYELLYIFKTAKCHKVAIRGNHDHEAETAELKQLFDEVYDYPIWISHRIVLSHFPCAVWKDQLNIHGHLHGSILDSPNHLCVSLHVANYQSINNHVADGRFGHLPKYNRRFLWEPWADKYRFTQKKEDIIYDKDRKIDLSASRLLQHLKQDGKIE